MSMPNVADVADLPNRLLLQIKNYLTIGAELASACERQKCAERRFQQVSWKDLQNAHFDQTEKFQSSLIATCLPTPRSACRFPCELK